VVISAYDAQAIDWCVKNSPCTLNKTISIKTESSPLSRADKTPAYIRVTIGPDLGDSPGSPYVMEIWPPHSHSPIHDHANTVAVIKVLSVSIMSSWYNPLATTGNVATQKPLKQASFSKGNITYLTPAFYQTHKLANVEDVTCVTIQAYMYLDSDFVHYETFDYIVPNDTALHHFSPNSDYQYLTMIQEVRSQYANRNVPQRNNRRRRRRRGSL